MQRRLPYYHGKNLAMMFREMIEGIDSDRWPSEEALAALTAMLQRRWRARDNGEFVPYVDTIPKLPDGWSLVEYTDAENGWCRSVAVAYPDGQIQPGFLVSLWEHDRMISSQGPRASVLSAGRSNQVIHAGDPFNPLTVIRNPTREEEEEIVIERAVKILRDEFGSQEDRHGRRQSRITCEALYDRLIASREKPMPSPWTLWRFKEKVWQAAHERAGLEPRIGRPPKKREE